MSNKGEIQINVSGKANNPSRILYQACPLCASKDISSHRTADCTQHQLYNGIIGPTILWKKCASCVHVFTEGYFTDEAARVIFGKTHDNQKVGHDIERQRYVSARMIENILPFVQTGHWLDVGFGNGSLLFTAHEYGFVSVGIDLRENNVSALRKFGLEAHCLDIDRLNHDGRYNIISMADVLEHMPFPKACLASVSRLLAGDGIVLISMPNSESMVWRALDQSGANPYWGEIEHFHNFSRKRLYDLLKECGFEPLRYGVSERYRACMEIVAKKSSAAPEKKSVISASAKPGAAARGGDQMMTINVGGNAAGKGQAATPTPQDAENYFRKGGEHKRLGRWHQAIESYDQAIAINPRQAKFYLNKANTLRELRRFEEALTCYDQAIAVNPDYADAYNNKGATLRDLKRSKEALACFDRAAALDPKSVSPLANRGNALREFKRLEEALQDYNQVLALKPNFDFMEGLRQHTRMHLCDWRDYPSATRILAEKVRSGGRAAIPYPLLALPSTPEEQLICAKVFTESQYPAQKPLWNGEPYKHDKIRIAYLSSDLSRTPPPI